MANMSRDNLVTELKARGWSRFLDAELQKYVDWALGYTRSRAQLKRETLEIATVSGTVLDVIPFTTISGAAADLVHQVLAVYARQSSSSPLKVDAASELEFAHVVWPNTQVSTPQVSAFPNLYFVYDLNVLLYPKPSAALDILIHWLRRKDVFSSGTDTSGLPERFDQAILWRALYLCAQRAKEWEEMAASQAMLDEFFMMELALENAQMEELEERIPPYRVA